MRLLKVARVNQFLLKLLVRGHYVEKRHLPDKMRSIRLLRKLEPVVPKTDSLSSVTTPSNRKVVTIDETPVISLERGPRTG